MGWREEIGRFVNAGLKFDEPMSAHTYMRVGGSADVFAELGNTDQLKKIVAFCNSQSIPLMVIGRGTNILVTDEGIRGVVAKLCGSFGEVKFSGDEVTVGAAASLLVAAAVSVSGLIGFVGLMTPHMARLVLGPDHRLLLPAATLTGAIVLVTADLAARAVLAPVELPVGIVTALTGGPFFVWLLLRWRRRTG